MGWRNLSFVQIVLIVITGELVSDVTSARILFLLPNAFRSETYLFGSVASKLAERGHKITYISPVPLSGPPNPNVTQFAARPPLTDADVFVLNDPLEERARIKNRFVYMATMNLDFILSSCHEVWQNPGFTKIVNEQQFDLIFISAYFNSCFNGLIQKLNVPFVTMTSVPIFSYISEYTTGFRFPTSFVPVSIFDYTDRMSLLERTVNFVLTGMMSVSDMFHHKEGTNMYRKYLNNPDLLDAFEIERQAAVVFSHSHPVLNFPRPTMPNMIEIGGIQCKDPKPLPKDIKDFVEGGEHGFIYFSLGTTVTPGNLPDHLRNVFLSTFAKLKQRVLWKWNEGKMNEQLPPNVKLAKWLPQQDVLGHKNIKLFIMQGGLLSLMEAMYHGVPQIGLPFFADQDSNMISSERIGLSINLEILELTEQIFLNGIKTILNNSSYAKTAEKVKKIFRDNPDKGPLDRAVYWTEYALNHKGAPHLKSPARDLNFFQYNSYDVMSLILVCCLVGLYMTMKLITLAVSLISNRKSSAGSKSQAKNIDLGRRGREHKEKLG